MRRSVTITSKTIKDVKESVSTGMYSLRQAAKKSNVSYYTAWCIVKGKYDTHLPLQEKKDNFDRCPITGLKYY